MRLPDPLHGFVIATLIALLLAANALTASAQGTLPSGGHWISLGPELSTASAGDTVTFRVSVGTSASYFPGDVLVTVPDGLRVVGQPMCISGCWLPEVLLDPTGSQIQTPVTVRSGESASLSFDVQVDSTAVIGTSYQLTAYLLGGVNTAGSPETAFATLQVTDSNALPTTPNRDQQLENEPPISFDPETLDVSPGETVRFKVRLANEGSMGTFILTLTLPEGVQYTGSPACFSLKPGQCLDANIETRATEASDGSTVVQLRGTNIYDTRFTFVFTVKVTDSFVAKEATITAAVESVRRWGTEPIAEESMIIMVDG